MKNIVRTALFLLGLIKVFGVDPIAWQARTGPTNIALNAIVFAEDKFVAVGDKTGPIITSPDGVTWTPHTSGVDKDLSGVAYGNDVFVATGYSGRVITSPDGSTWTPQSMGTSAHFNRLRFVNGLFVTTGDGGNIYSSPNGVDWTPHSTPSTNYWQDITFLNGKYVAIGYNYKNSDARYGVSTDLESWTIGDTGYDMYLSFIFVADGKLLGLGYAGAAQWSEDGLNWTTPVSASTRWIFGADKFGGMVAAVGESGSIATWTEADGWIRGTSGTKESINDVAFGNGTFVAVGEKGIILQSESLMAESVVTLSDLERNGNQVTFQLAAEAGQTYQIEATTGFETWAPVGTVTCTTSLTPCTINDQNEGVRFYRARQL